MDRGPDRVDVLRDMFRKVIAVLAGDVSRPVLVLVLVVLRPQHRFRLGDSHVQVEVTAVLAKADARGIDTALASQPFADGVDRVRRRSECFSDAGRGPVFPVVG